MVGVPTSCGHDYNSIVENLEPKKKVILKKTSDPLRLLRQLPHSRGEKLTETNFRRLTLVQMRSHDLLLSLGVPERKGNFSQILKVEPRCVYVDIFRNAGLDPTVATHYLGIEPGRRPVK